MTGRKALSLEDRIEQLERSRYRMLGHVNALNTLILALWVEHLAQQPEGAEQALERRRTYWLDTADEPRVAFPGADPDHLQMVTAEYRKALERLTDLLHQHTLASKSGRLGK